MPSERKATVTGDGDLATSRRDFTADLDCDKQKVLLLLTLSSFHSFKETNLHFDYEVATTLVFSHNEPILTISRCASPAHGHGVKQLISPLDQLETSMSICQTNTRGILIHGVR